ncbi:MAG: class I SAM-dependent rRNA methyltransferase [Vicinamibacterales bacterium]|jgi:23S rRNA (cytosine1962-C5)-methyltransferase|nr:class I SAM-dependent rRNA methyltransferase [Vicinamibacterales bacterium]MDP6608920.1 class I SAM-dependent rRNA methyltransferase [Vicinamibacterales bacterium]|tara:strand:- start:2354 stop:3520 length:1167 start_codon:yes stop_codon:yes gene_type:complete
MPSTVTLSRRGEARLRSGHVWVYRSDIVSVEAEGGDLVVLEGQSGRQLGVALFSDRSDITIRLVSRGRESELPGIDFWRARIRAAIAYREALEIDATAYRVVHAEGDRLPSLIVDRYADHLVIQTLSQGSERLLPMFCDLLEETLAPRGILERNDPRVRELEGLERRVGVVRGQVPERLEVHQHGVGFEVDPRAGQKTGLFLDQRENHLAAGRYARGRALDCFSYTGGFSLAMAARCDEVMAVDASGAALETLARQATRRGVRVVGTEGNVFDLLRALERDGERFDTIVLDPPAFAKNRRALPKATAGYKEINLRALKLLRPGGVLVTCSCSYHLDEAGFAQMLYEASLDAHAPVVVVEKRMQARDHPVVLGIPETYYLKCFIVRRMA